MESGEFGPEHSGVVLVLDEGRTEFMEEEGFFAASFEIEGGVHEQEAQKIAHLAMDQTGAEEG